MTNESFALLDIENQDAVTDVLTRTGTLRTGEIVEMLDIAGPGNMNLVLRVTTNFRTLIVKQSRPWVERYPAIEAPEDRIFAEIDFYRLVESFPEVAACMPAFIGHDRELHVMVMEDLGAAADYGHVYASQEFSDLPIQSACHWLASLHRESRTLLLRSEGGAGIGSDSLRRLNHEHMFVIPFQDASTIDLDAITRGMSQLAQRVCDQTNLLARIQTLGDSYLNPNGKSDGPFRGSLLHGDYYPGSWLHTSDGLRVIDAEFCFVGPVEFDLAILKAHVLLSGGSLNDAGAVDTAYRNAFGNCEAPDQVPGDLLNENLVNGWMGVEVLRRLMGVAQLPVPSDLPLKKHLIDTSVDLILGVRL